MQFCAGQIWLQANRFAQSQFREWRTSSTAKLPVDIQREEDAWVRELDDNTPANVQRICRTLMLCFGPQRIADTVCVEKLGPERALASVFYPDTLQFRADTGGKASPLFRADTLEDVGVANEQWHVPCARAGKTLPDYVADYFAIVWDILYEPTTPVTAPMRSAVACEFLYRVAATVRMREASCFVPV